LKLFSEDSKADLLLEEKLAETKKLSMPPSEGEPVFEFLKRQLEFAIGLEETTMLVASSRARWLYQFGQLFLIASVMGPVAAAWIYWQVEPLSESTVANLLDLKSGLGGLPDSIALTVHRDWHVLLGGVTFGFLFLAAGSGLLRHQGKEHALYSLAGERVNSYRRLIAVLEIKKRVGEKRSESDLNDELVKIVVERLLLDDWKSVVFDKEKASDVGVLDIVKALKGVG